MNFNFNDWNFNNNLANEVPLQEPVAFEDFQFSFGLDPNFSMPIPLDMPPPPPPPTTTSMMEVPLFMNDIPVSSATTTAANSVLNENDQKAFSQFLDQFFVDPNMQTVPIMYLDQEEEYYRQTSILQSLDEQKKKHNIKEQVGGGAIRRNKELLTEEEKRNNHIASEQKRRSMIRTGFKDLTDIVPTLKNINNSKSTVLFKAVDYIKYLEKRNRNLRDKIKNLEVRVEGNLMQHQQKLLAQQQSA